MTVTPLGAGERRVVVACRCATVGRHYPVDVPLAEAVAELLDAAGRTAPLCRHPDPTGIGARP